MQTLPAPARQAIEQDTTVEITPVVYAEWMHNRFNDDVSVWNADADFNALPLEWEESSLYPISSIIENNRPTTGMPKALVGHATLYNGTGIRHKIADESDPYKYWASPNKSASYGVMGLQRYIIRQVKPCIKYQKPVYTNKIIIKFETSWARPVTTIVRVGGSVPRTVISRSLPDENGVLELYLHGNGEWHTNENYRHGTWLQSLSVEVTTVNKPNARLGVVEMGFSYMTNISDDVIDVNLRQSREEADLLLPIGVSSANTCSIDLANEEGKYSPDNPDSLLHGLLDVNTKFYVSVNIRGTDGLQHRLKLGEFYSNSWSSNDNITMTVDCYDYSKFLQQQQTPSVLFHNQPAQTIIRELLEMAGFNQIKFDKAPQDDDLLIPYVWFTSEETLWESMQSVAKAEQASFYFDENTVMRYSSRNYIYRSGLDTILYEDSPFIQPNIISLQEEFNVEANKAIVRYTPLKENTNGGYPFPSILWEPQDQEVLHSSPIASDITSSSSYIEVLPAVAETMPYEGMLNVEGEFMRYQGKLYKYRTTAGHTRTTWINSLEEQQATDRISDQRYAFQNHYTGRLRVTERGLFDSLVRVHEIRRQSDWGSIKHFNGSSRSSGEDRIRLEEGRLLMTQPSNTNYDAYATMFRGGTSSRYDVYGTVIRFKHGSVNHGMAGMALNLDSSGIAGWYFELVTTEYSINKRAGSIGNVRCYKMDASGNKLGYPQTAEGKRGYDFNIAPGAEYNLEVVQFPGGVAGVVFEVYVNGTFITRFTDSQYTSGKFGTFVRGHTRADFEYFFAHLSRRVPSIREAAVLHAIRGGYFSKYVPLARNMIVNGRTDRLETIYDEFYPVVHEVKEWDVEHSVSPSVTASVYHSNDFNALLLSHQSDPFGSRFMMANTSRRLAVLKGDDPTVFAGRNIQQELAVYGQAIVRGEEETFEVEDASAVRKRGRVEVEFDSPWIQRSAQAETIGNFITKHWAEPVDFVTVEIFPNPALQVGDRVGIRYQSKGMNPNRNMYHILAIEFSVGTSFSQRLTLRRIR